MPHLFHVAHTGCTFEMILTKAKRKRVHNKHLAIDPVDDKQHKVVFCSLFTGVENHNDELVVVDVCHLFRVEEDGLVEA